MRRSFATVMSARTASLKPVVPGEKYASTSRRVRVGDRRAKRNCARMSTTTSRHALQPDHAVRDVLRDHDVPLDRLTRRRVRLPVRPPILVVGDGAQRADDARQILEVLEEPEHGGQRAVDLHRRTQRDTAAPLTCRDDRSFEHGSRGVRDQRQTSAAQQHARPGARGARRRAAHRRARPAPAAVNG